MAIILQQILFQAMIVPQGCGDFTGLYSF